MDANWANSALVNCGPLSVVRESGMPWRANSDLKWLTVRAVESEGMSRTSMNRE